MTTCWREHGKVAALLQRGRPGAVAPASAASSWNVAQWKACSLYARNSAAVAYQSTASRSSRADDCATLPAPRHPTKPASATAAISAPVLTAPRVTDPAQKRRPADLPLPGDPPPSGPTGYLTES
jgi:hypothetical protein